MAVSLAMGGTFLDHFAVARPVRTILLCGESGWPVFQENIRRISVARGATEEQLGNLLTGIRLPKFGNALHQDTLCTYIIEQKPKWSLSIVPIGASPRFRVESVCDGRSSRFDRQRLGGRGATLILLCHTPKHVPAGNPLELDNLAFAGFSEFAAQWFIVNRIRPYEPGTGRHALWAVIGGRAGHSGTYAIDLDEGEFHPGEDREWRVAVSKADQARQEQRDSGSRTGRRSWPKSWKASRSES